MTTAQVSLSEFWRSVEVVDAYGSRLDCEAFDNKLVKLDWLRQYIRSRSNMMLFENEPLPKGLLAGVFKWEQVVNQALRSLFAIVVAPLEDQVLKQLAIAHEVGHIFLHGRIMQSQMFVAQPATPWNREDNSLRRLLEMEANIFALLSLAPTRVITELESITSHEVTTASLQQALSHLYDWHVDQGLVQERLLIHHVLTCARDPVRGLKEQAAPKLEAEFRSFLVERRSWVIDGPTGMRRRQECPTPRPAAVLDERVLAQLSQRLMKAGTISPEHFVLMPRERAW